jgi:hypothetical protein
MLEEPEDIAASRCSTLLHYTWKLCTCLFSHVTLVTLVVSYCIMGAFTFQNLEAHNEIKVRLCRLLVAVFLWLPAAIRVRVWRKRAVTSIQCRG